MYTQICTARVRKRYYWVVVTFGGDPDVNVHGDGFAESLDGALKAANSCAQDAGVAETPNRWRQVRHSNTAQWLYKQRYGRPMRERGGAGAHRIDYVYRWYEPLDGPQELSQWVKHAIVKTTAKYVFVSKNWDGGPYRTDDPTIRLDRAELDQDGSAWSRTAGHRFYTQDGIARDRLHRLEWHARHLDECPNAMLLGLIAPFTEERINVAFRRASLQAHPDHGGSNEAFRNVVQARDALLAQHCGGTSRKSR